MIQQELNSRGWARFIVITMASYRAFAPYTEQHPDKANYYIDELCNSAIATAATGDYPQALQLLSKSQELLEALNSQGKSTNADSVLTVLHNTAYCHQK